MSDHALTAEAIEALGYHKPRQLPDGHWAALVPLLYTTGLVVGIESTGWRYRYCFEQAEDALSWLGSLQAVTQEPEGYVAKRVGIQPQPIPVRARRSDPQ